MENVLSDTADERQEGDRRGGSDPDPGWKFHPVFGVCIVWIEWKCVDKSY